MAKKTQAETFRKLKQTPYDDMQPLLTTAKTKHSPVFNLGLTTFESKKHEIVRHYEMIKCLNDHGWEFEEFVLEAEKRNILSAIDEYNKNHRFPDELVERAKEFFPNARFTQAKIELE